MIKADLDAKIKYYHGGGLSKLKLRGTIEITQRAADHANHVRKDSLEFARLTVCAHEKCNVPLSSAHVFLRCCVHAPKPEPNSLLAFIVTCDFHSIAMN